MGLSGAQIAKPSPSGGRINIQSRRVQCTPPTNLVVTVNNNNGNDGWIRLQIQVGMQAPVTVMPQVYTHLALLYAACLAGIDAAGACRSVDHLSSAPSQS